MIILRPDKETPVLTPIETSVTRGIHQDTVRDVRKLMPAVAELNRLAELFKLFGDGTRIAILWALTEAELCVRDLCALLRMKQPAVSHQLKNLKQSRVVKARREGKVIFYSLDDDHIDKIGRAHV